MTTSVGFSSYGDLKGVEQFMTNDAAALQVNSVIQEFGTTDDGGHLSVNEGDRNHARQLLYWNNYVYFLNHGAPYAALAAQPYTSTHDPDTYGNATDFGITLPDGSNRALTFGEHAKLVGLGVRRGIIWTGADFSTVEQWHFNTYPERATVPPITPIPETEDDEMTARLYRNSVTGEIGIADTSTGYYEYMPPGYPALNRARKLVIDEDPIDLNAGEWGYLQHKLTIARQIAAGTYKGA